MTKPTLDWLKQYFNFSKKDRNAILTLSILIFLVFIGHIFVNRIHHDSEIDFVKVEQTLKEWEQIEKQESVSLSLFSFDPNTISENELDSLLLPEYVKTNIIKYRSAGGKFRDLSDVKKIYGMNDSIFATIKDYVSISLKDKHKTKPVVKDKVKSENTYNGYFDPNTASKEVLKKIGFNNYQADNLIKYREMRGRLNTPAELLKIYGIDTAFFYSIKNYISIKEQKHNPKNSNQERILIELNSADSTQLVKLKGIGPVLSSRIIKFRQLLGGFYSKKQLLEVYNLQEEIYNNIENKISVDSSFLKKIRVNFADFKELVRHPYLGKEQVNKIIRFRDKHGRFNSIDELYENELLKKSEFDKIKPYLTCR